GAEALDGERSGVGIGGGGGAYLPGSLRRHGAGRRPYGRPWVDRLAVARARGVGHLGLRLLGHVRRLLRDTIRATVVRMRIMTTSVVAAPQARACRLPCAWPTSEKICAGSEFIGPLRLKLVPLTIVVVKSNGAVSPAARAIARRMPVMRPGSAVGSTMRATTRQRRAPRPRAPSRR